MRNYNEMNTEDKQFLDNCSYFWQEKGDMRRYSSFDMDRLQKLAPHWALALQQYEFNGNMLDSLTKE